MDTTAPAVPKWRATKAYATHALCADGKPTGYTVRPVMERHLALYVVCFETEPVAGTQSNMSRQAKQHAEKLYRERAMDRKEVSMRNAWNVYIGGRRIATVMLADSEVRGFRLRLEDDTADLRLAAWEAGTLKV